VAEVNVDDRIDAGWVIKNELANGLLETDNSAELATDVLNALDNAGFDVTRRAPKQDGMGKLYDFIEEDAKRASWSGGALLEFPGRLS
jgi:hypothetical protein